MFKSSSHLFGALVVMMLACASPALAGPPLICHPFDTAGGALLEWGDGSGWNLPHPSYDVKKLPAEVARLLDADSPVLTRMENLRRATIYAMKDPQVAHQLLTVVMGRAMTPRSNAQAWFDAGYLIESYKQATHMRGHLRQGYGAQERGSLWSIDKAWTATDETLKVDGYGFVKKAIAMAGAPNAEMEFAASLMTQGTVASAHRARAAASAARGSVLAQNLAKLG
jgi:hypothetical protein